ncbi:2-dehydropantoate 2-reductase (Ketopantoate reductase) (KPA reductase) (KPR) [Steccherinum ochraceum]|uniref:2-dehydropantoate 2-reductase n=1 Tax=Steccherinum ochraceum TaxID=92696 RepID=A0A4R0RCA4_9APHY|nr:2-dehydropantoate 2-reductase (Ketopantoate reductase) (KPA reductase) (KPR) [Steccherinum ochraceum]
MLQGFKQSVKDLFNPGAGNLLWSGQFWSRRRRLPWRESRVVTHVKPAEKAVEKIDTLLVCVKAQSTLATIRGLLPRLSANSTIVLLQNGMGVYDELVRELFPDPQQRPHIVHAVITHGAWIKNYMHVVHAGVGKIDIGIMPDGQGRDFEISYHKPGPLDFLSQPRLHLKDIMSGAGDLALGRYRTLHDTVGAMLRMNALQVSWLPIYDIQMAMRQKVVVNAVINPLTALLDCKNGKLMEHRHARNLCRAICWEAEVVFRAQWEHERRDTDDMSTFPIVLQTKHLEHLCFSVASATANNISSMLADVRLRRPTEIEYMTGYLIRLGRKYGVRTRTNLALYNIIRMRTALDVESSDTSFTPRSSTM